MTHQAYVTHPTHLLYLPHPTYLLYLPHPTYLLYLPHPTYLPYPAHLTYLPYPAHLTYLPHPTPDPDEAYAWADCLRSDSDAADGSHEDASEMSGDDGCQHLDRL